MIKKKSGFSLIELVLTIVILAILALPISIVLSQYVESAVYASDITAASNLARLEMEKVYNLDYNSIDIETVTINYGNYDVIKTVVYEGGSDSSAESLKKVTIEVTRSGGSKVITSLATYFTNNVSYGV